MAKYYQSFLNSSITFTQQPNQELQAIIVPAFQQVTALELLPKLGPCEPLFDFRPRWPKTKPSQLIRTGNGKCQSPLIRTSKGDIYLNLYQQVLSDFAKTYGEHQWVRIHIKKLPSILRGFPNKKTYEWIWNIKKWWQAERGPLGGSRSLKYWQNFYLVSNINIFH